MILRRFHLVVLLTLLACGPIRSFCQVDTAPWCPPGAMWFYEESRQTSVAWHRYSYLKDTIVGAEQYKVILEATSLVIYSGDDGRLPYDTIDRHLLLSRDDSIFVLENDTHRLLYDFGAEPGGQWPIQALTRDTSYCYPSIRSDSMIVSDTLEFTSGTYRGLLIDVFSKESKWSIGDIVRRIGSRVSFFPYTPFEGCPQDNFSTGNLACYFDSLRGWVEFDNIQPCPIYTSVNRRPLGTDLIEWAYPNPSVDGRIRVRMDHSVREWILYDGQGQMVRSGFPSESDVYLRLPGRGLFLLVAFSESGGHSVQRLVKP